MLRRRPADRFALTPVYADAFTAPRLGLITFTRDRAGHITGLTLGTDRVRELRFARVAAAQGQGTDRDRPNGGRR